MHKNGALTKVMTQKGKHNHYNVKFLNGYGFSIKD